MDQYTHLLMALIQISFENEVCEVKWQQFYNKIVNKYDSVTDMELILTHDIKRLV